LAAAEGPGKNRMHHLSENAASLLEDQTHLLSFATLPDNHCVDPTEIKELESNYRRLLITPKAA